MNAQSMTERLGSLILTDMDAVRAYDQAIEEVDVEAIRETMLRFRDEHQNHIVEMSAVIRELGGTPPECEPDAGGFECEQFSAIQSLSGAEDALKAMHANEKVINYIYGAARGWELTPAASALVERHYRQEQRHLRAVREVLAERVWEQPQWRYEFGELRPRANRRLSGY